MVKSERKKVDEVTIVDYIHFDITRSLERRKALMSIQFICEPGAIEEAASRMVQEFSDSVKSTPTENRTIKVEVIPVGRSLDLCVHISNGEGFVLSRTCNVSKFSDIRHLESMCRKEFTILLDGDDFYYKIRGNADNSPKGRERQRLYWKPVASGNGQK